jgi:hypothetical protein
MSSLLQATLMRTRLERRLPLIAASLIAAWASFTAGAVLAQQPAGNGSPPTQEAPPAWLTRGLPGQGHRALEPLVGKWHVHMYIHGTFGRDPNAPPIESDDLTCVREWVAAGRYIEDTTTGTAAGGDYWRRGWLGYSNMDRRYEWVTIDAVNSTMMRYEGKPGSGVTMPIDMVGVFTDQGVAGESAVGKSVPMRTVIRIENEDRHVLELYFTPPGKQEMLATRAVYTRIKG